MKILHSHMPTRSFLEFFRGSKPKCNDAIHTVHYLITAAIIMMLLIFPIYCPTLIVNKSFDIQLLGASTRAYDRSSNITSFQWIGWSS